MLKRVLRSNAFISAAGSLAAAYVKLVQNTSRAVREPADLEERMIEESPCICAMWHGQFLMIPAYAPKALKFKCMVARHGDAALLGKTLEKFGMELIRGAGAGQRRKDRGGAHALRAAIATLEEGANVSMTAEVPPGPARKAGIGIVTLAKLSGRPIVPVAIASSRFASLNSWSRFTINLPFSKMGIVSGEKIVVPQDADEAQLAAARQAVEDSLNAATRRAYELADRNMEETLPVNAGGRVSPGFSFRLYRGLSRLVHPLAGTILRRRCKRGKEVPERLNERMGIASLKRPDNKLIWFHAASVGETNVVLPLIHMLSHERPDLAILLTTVTVTSAKIAAARLPANAIHQFIPLDTPAFVKRFLEHWRPSMALFIESEIWPNLIMDADRRRIPLVLLNAFISDRSFRRWMKLKGLSRPIFSRFSVILAQSDSLAKRLGRLGARKVISAGNLKFDAPPPLIDQAELARLKASIGERPVFLAASTHPGEEEMIAEVHKALTASQAGLLTIIIPRHPERGGEIAALLAQQGVDAIRRSEGTDLTPQTGVYIADTLGELGLFYSLAPFALIGGSMIPHGGHNPIEAAKLGTGIITGPHWHYFPEVYQALAEKGGCRFVTSEDDLIQTARALFDDPASLELMKARAEDCVAELGGALDRTMAALEPLLPPKEPAPMPATGEAYAS